MIRWLMLAWLLIAAPVAAQGVRTATLNADNGAGRSVPITVVAKPGKARGLIYFSHGALSAPAKYSAMTTWWARAGYVVIAPLHADSTDWKGLKPAREQQTEWRLHDMRLARAEEARLLAAVGADAARSPRLAAGHSFGALIAMLDPDPKVRAIVAFSPPGPVPGLTIPVVTKPMLTFTGTADVLPMIAPKWEAHLAAHDKATGVAVACVGDGVDHYFGGMFGRPELPGPRQQEQFDTAMAQSFRFLRSFAPMMGMRGAAIRSLAGQGCRVRGAS
jgi:dienelactone hydrolase